MKQEIKLVKYTCDTCNNVFESRGGKFPYDQGWCYIYAFKGRKAQNGSFYYLEDKHYCQKNCLINSITEVLK